MNSFYSETDHIFKRLDSGLNDMLEISRDTNLQLSQQNEVLSKIPEKIEEVSSQIDTATSLLGSSLASSVKKMGRVAIISGLICAPAALVVGIKGAAIAYGISVLSNVI